MLLVLPPFQTSLPFPLLSVTGRLPTGCTATALENPKPPMQLGRVGATGLPSTQGCTTSCLSGGCGALQGEAQPASLLSPVQGCALSPEAQSSQAALPFRGRGQHPSPARAPNALPHALCALLSAQPLRLPTPGSPPLTSLP